MIIEMEFMKKSLQSKDTIVKKRLIHKGVSMQIKSTKDIKPNKINALIYGESGVGKTTLGGTLPPKTLIVSLESGLMSLKNKAIDYVEIEGSTGVEKINHLKSLLSQIAKSDYDTLFIDSLTEIAQCFVEYAKNEYPDDRQTMKMYGYYNELITKFIKYTRDLNKNVFYTCLQKTDKDEVGRRFHLPDMAGSIALRSPAYFDFVFTLRVFEKDGEKIRALQTSPDGGYICKDRSGILEQFESPDLGEIINKVFNKG